MPSQYHTNFRNTKIIAASGRNELLKSRIYCMYCIVLLFKKLSFVWVEFNNICRLPQ